MKTTFWQTTEPFSALDFPLGPAHFRRGIDDSVLESTPGDRHTEVYNMSKTSSCPTGPGAAITVGEGS